MTIRNPPSRPRFPTVPGATMIVAAVRDACVVEWSGRVADCRHGGGGCDDRLVPVSQVGEAIPARVTEVYDQMMRGVIGSAQRDLGFRGRLREFRYGSGSQFGTVAWQKDGWDLRRQVLRCTANVTYCRGADRIGELMPVPAGDTWWEIAGVQPSEPVGRASCPRRRRHVIDQPVRGR
jgi:hypothetical protein